MTYPRPFSMTLAVFHDFPVRVVTLSITCRLTT